MLSKKVRNSSVVQMVAEVYIFYGDHILNVDYDNIVQNPWDP